MLNIEGNIILYFLVVCLLIFTAFIIDSFVRKSLNAFAFSASIMLFLYFISYALLGTSGSTIVKYLPQTIIFLFFGSIMFGIKDYEYLFYYLRKNAIFFVIMLSFVLLRRGDLVYVMSSSYLMLIPTLIHIMLFFKKKKLVYFLLFIYELVFIFLVGSRGPLVVTFLFFLFCYMRYAKKKMEPLFVLFFGALTVLLIFANGEAIYSFLVRIGINSRSIMLLLTDFSHDSGRGDLKDIARTMIEERQLFGWGVGGDSLHMKGSYVHNIWYELLIDFGVVGGFLAFASLSILFFIALVKTRFNPFIMLFICFGFVPLFFSNSYLISYEFALCVFVAINAVKNPNCASSLLPHFPRINNQNNMNYFEAAS